MGKGIDLSGLHMNLVTDALENIMAEKMTAQALAEQRARQSQLDADAREERAYQRRRLEAQDARTARMDDEAREGKLTREGLELATLFPGKVVSGNTVRRYPKYLHELIATPKDQQLASRSIGGVSVAGDPNAGAIDIDEHQAIGPDSYELQLPVSERSRLAAERQAAAETKREADERFRQEKLDRDMQHKERMAEIAAQRAARGGSGGNLGGVGSARGELDAVADMVTNNPDLLKDFAPKDRGRIIAHMAQRGAGTLRNQRADASRAMLDTASETIRRLRGDDAQGHRGQGAPGFRGAVGAKGPTSLFGLLEKPIAGTDAANFAATVDALRAQLTLPELQKMRGLGAMSDREFATLSSGATTLSRALSEEDFLAELDRIERTLAAVRSRLPDAGLALDESLVVDDPRRPGGAARAGAPDRSLGLDGMIKPRTRTVRVQAPNGQTREVPENEVSIYTARGGKVVR